MVGLEPPPQHFLSTVLCNSCARFRIPPLRADRGSRGAGFQGGPEGLFRKENVQSVRFPSLSVPFCKRGAAKGYSRWRPQKKKRPRAFRRGAQGGGSRASWLAWFGWIYPCSGEKRRDLSRMGSLAISFKGWIWCWLAGTSPSLRTTDMCPLFNAITMPGRP